MHDRIETERLILRRFTPADADHLVALDGDPEVMRFLTGGPGTPREALERDILPGFLRASAGGDGFGFWAAHERASGAFLGWFSFRPQEEKEGGAPGEAALGYRLRRAVWGKGYATEGARALIARGFAELGVRRVVASTYEHNRASRRVMEKAGLIFARAFRLTPDALAAGDTAHHTSDEVWDGDEVEYALSREEWARQEGARAAGE